MPLPHSGIAPAHSSAPHPDLPSSHVPWSPTLCVLLDSWFICGLYASDRGQSIQQTKTIKEHFIQSWFLLAHEYKVDGFLEVSCRSPRPIRHNNHLVLLIFL